MRKLRKKKPIVAWRVTGWDSFFSFIIFATTKYKAKKIYEKLVPKEFYYCTAIREPCGDKYYVKDKTFLDWSIPKDRQILYKHFNYGCLYTSEDCESCIVKDICNTWKRSQK